jgi:nitroreductase
MELHEALYTTRAMRRVRPDPVPVEVQRKMLDAAVRAPSGGNSQDWRFLLVDDPGIKGRIGPLYRDAIDKLWKTAYKDRLDVARAAPEDPDNDQMLRVVKSAQWLADHFEEVPLFLFGYTRFDPNGGSIFPAIWNAQLAARAEGVGSAITSVLSFFHPDETNAILGVPKNENWTMACCVSFGYPTGRWGVAARRPAHEVTHRNAWGAPAGFATPEPLWSPT